MAPGGAPLPRGVAGALAETGIGFPEVGDPFVDKFLVFPALLQNDSLDSHVHDGVGAGIEINVQATVFFRIGHAGGAARIDHNDLAVIAVDALQDPMVPQHGFSLERIGAGDDHTVRQGEIFV